MSSTEQNWDEKGYPIAYPIGSSTNAPLTSTNFDSGSANDGAHAGTTQTNPAARRQPKNREIEHLAERLSERDFAIMRSVAEHQFLTVRQIEKLHFADHASISGSRIARRTLARLRDLRLLDTLERRIGGVRGGSAGIVHYVDVVGDQLLSGRSGRKSHRYFGWSPRFVNHRLAIADARLALIEADRQHQVELVDSAVEPASWRRYVGVGGARLNLKADLYSETASPPGSELVHAWFVEIDLGTESISTLLKKCRDYESYRRTGTEQEEGGFPIVVWSMTHADPDKAERRRLALREGIDHDRSLISALFRVISPDQLVSLLANGGVV